MFGFNFAPLGWAFCNGQLLSIAQNTALFSLLGTTYGGNGQTPFALPNLQSRWPVHFGQGPGLSPYALGQMAGTETVTISINQMPAHQHPYAPLSNNSEAGVAKPGGGFMGKADAAVYSATGTTPMGPQNTASTGGTEPTSLLQPYLALNFCIALEGIFPSRN